MFYFLQTTLILSHLTHTHSYIQQSAFIRANKWIVGNLSDGFNFHTTSRPGSTVDGSKWNINVVSQYGSDLSISLETSWGFHPSLPSTISIIINGSTPNETLHNNGDIIFLFSVSDKYFTSLTHLDTSQRPFNIYPSNSQPLASGNINNIIDSASPHRLIRYIQNNSWSTAPTVSNISFTDAAIWPMYINITNDPIQNTMTYQWNDDTYSETVIITYNTSFTANEGMNIYISGDDPNEHFTIYSFNISNHVLYEATTTSAITTTETPTVNPTIVPTTNPTIVSSTDTAIFMNTTDMINTTSIISTINTVFNTMTTRSLYTTFLETFANTLVSVTENIRFTTNTRNRTRIESSETTIQTSNTVNEDSGEVFEKTSIHSTVSVEITPTEHILSVISINSTLIYILIVGILLFGVICCICGICIGITYYKNKLNVNKTQNNNNNEDDDSNIDGNLKYDKNIMMLPNLEQHIRNSNRKPHDIEVNETGDRHESLYGDNGSPTKGLQLLDRGKHASDRESAVLDILIHQDAVDKALQESPQKDHNIHDIDEYIEDIMNERYEIVSATHKLAINDQILDGSRSNFDNVSVNYADNDDEKENRLIKTRTHGGELQNMVKKYGIMQPDVFPDDEGSKMRIYIDAESMDHETNSEIELHVRNEAQNKKDIDKIEKNRHYFKVIEKIMLDEGSSIGDTEALDVIAPLPEFQQMHKLNVNSVFMFNGKRKSLSHSHQSQTIHSHKTGHSFESLIDDEKQIEVLDDDDEGDGYLEDDVEDMTHDELQNGEYHE